MELVYIRAVTDFEHYENETVDTLTHPLSFAEDVHEVMWREMPESIQENVEEFNVFCLVGDVEEITGVSSHIADIVKNHFELLANAEDAILTSSLTSFEGLSKPFLLASLYFESVFESEGTHFPIWHHVEFDDGFSIVAFTSCDSPSAAELTESFLVQWIDSWIDMEQPLLCGKQVVTRSFDLAQLRNRRVIAPHFDLSSNQWELLLDGANRIHLGNDAQLLPTDSSVVNQWTTEDIRQIISNPVYGFGIVLYLPGRLTDWHTSFVYLCATRLSEKELNPSSVLSLYKRFLLFMTDRFGFFQVQSIISEEQFAAVLCRTIDDVRKYISGFADEDRYGKALISTMPWRTYFLNELSLALNLYVKESEGTVLERNTAYCKTLRECSEQAADSPYSKGERFERLTQQLIDQVSGLKLTGKRIRSRGCEIDLCYSNVSLDDNLWKMGALILVECKHWKKSVGIGVLRNLVYVMQTRGCTTGILASFCGFTDVVLKEINLLALSGIFILLFSEEDFACAQRGKNVYDLLVGKYQALSKLIENDIRIFA